MKFVKRKINVSIQLGEGNYGDDLGDEITLEGYRVSAQGVTYNGDAQGQLQIRVWGMRLDLINQLTKIGPIMNQRRNNRIVLTAGEEGGAMSTVYEGTIDTAFGDFRSSPEPVFNVVALSAALAAVKPVAASSYNGQVDAAAVMSDLADKMNLIFENNGVSFNLNNPNFSGSALEQVKSCARAANIFYTVDRGKLAIWPKSGNRGDEPIQIDVDNDMIGYPAFSSEGITLQTIFNPDLRLGGQVQVKSILTVACGIWNVYKMSFDLESEVPDGKWFSTIDCYRLNNNG